MSDTVRTRSELVALLATNGVGAITAQNMRDWLISSPLLTDISGTYLPLAGGTMTGDINMGGHDLIQVDAIDFADSTTQSTAYPGVSGLAAVLTVSGDAGGLAITNVGLLGIGITPNVNALVEIHTNSDRNFTITGVNGNPEISSVNDAYNTIEEFLLNGNPLTLNSIGNGPVSVGGPINLNGNTLTLAAGSTQTANGTGTTTATGDWIFDGPVGIGATNGTLLGLGPVTINAGTDCNLNVRLGTNVAGVGGVALQALNDAVSAQVPLVFSASEYQFLAGATGIFAVAGNQQIQIDLLGGPAYFGNFGNDGANLYGFSQPGLSVFAVDYTTGRMVIGPTFSTFAEQLHVEGSVSISGTTATLSIYGTSGPLTIGAENNTHPVIVDATRTQEWHFSGVPVMLNDGSGSGGALKLDGAVIDIGNNPGGTPTNVVTPAGWQKIVVSGADSWLPYYQ